MIQILCEIYMFKGEICKTIIYLFEILTRKNCEVTIVILQYYYSYCNETTVITVTAYVITIEHCTNIVINCSYHK